MANLLRDLIVDRVSFVDRAAVRDPENPTEPQRYLVVKSETTAPPKEEPTVTTATEEADVRAQEIRKAERGLTREQALAMVYEEDPILLLKAVNESSGLHSTGRYLTPGYEEVRQAIAKHQGDPEEWLRVVKSEMIADLMNELGSSDAAELWTKLVASVRKSERGLTIEQAVAMVLEEAPQLAESYNNAFAPVIDVEKADTSPAARGRAELVAGAIRWAEKAGRDDLLAGSLADLIAEYEKALRGGKPPSK
jgi:hypothetical protein